jgi:diadenylate cyclase
MSETTDAMVVITSEETGTISVAHRGTLCRGFTEAELREVLLDYLIDSSSDKLSANKDSLKKLFKGWKK